MNNNEKLRVKWNNALSSKFTVSNGGVISSILYCVYIDGIISELRDSDVGYHMDGTYAGTFVFADDLE